jgi:hypothetical protein
MPKVRAGWTPTMERRAKDRAGEQVKCLTADAGHVWIHYYDRLPPPVRHRLAEGVFNICPACVWCEAKRIAGARRLRQPSVAVYLAVIADIERQLNEGERRAVGS